METVLCCWKRRLYCANGMYYHFEFESDSISEEDLKRFREYEASTARIYNAPVVTYMICSSGVKKLRDSITEGINTYLVRLIRLKDENAETTFSKNDIRKMDRDRISTVSVQSFFFPSQALSLNVFGANRYTRIHAVTE